MNSFLLGVISPAKGLGIILSNSELKKMALIPVVATILSLFVGIFVGFSYSAEIVSLVFGRWIDPSGGMINAVFNLAGYILITIVVFMLSYLVASLISIPFNSIIAEKTLAQIGALTIKPETLSEKTIKFLKMLRVSVLKAVVVLFLVSFVFIGSFLPGISIIAIYLGLLLLAFDCVDYSLEIYEMSLKDRFSFLRQHISALSGFALTLGVVFLIPFFNFLLLPVAVSGGAYLVGQVKNAKQ